MWRDFPRRVLVVDGWMEVGTTIEQRVPLDRALMCAGGGLLKRK